MEFFRYLCWAQIYLFWLGGLFLSGLFLTRISCYEHQSHSGKKKKILYVEANANSKITQECPGARVNPLALCPDVYRFSCTLTLQGKLWSFQTDLLTNGSLNGVCFRVHFSPAAPAICCFWSCSPFFSHYKIHHLKLEQYCSQKGNSISNSYNQNVTQLELV